MWLSILSDVAVVWEKTTQIESERLSVTVV